MIIEGGTMWGEIRGKMRLTPEEAWELFGFRMKPGAKGVFFRVRKGKQQICNLFPQRGTRTNLQVRAMERIGSLGKIARDIKGLIDSCWRQLHLGRFSTGKELFISRNSKLVGLELKWEKLLVVDGRLTPPEVSWLFFKGDKLFVRVSNFDSGVRLGICVFVPSKCKMVWLGEFCKGKISIPASFRGKGDRCIVYLYFRRGSIYSRSVSFKRG